MVDAADRFFFYYGGADKYVGVAEAPAGNPEQNASNTPKPKDEEQAIRVRELPPVSVSRDWADWILWVFNGLLVAGGFWGIRLAYKTLKTVERQTTATETAAKSAEEAAKATEKSVRLQEVQLRQWVDIENWRATPWIPEGGTLSLHIQFDVVNPTNLPLMLNSVFIMLGAHGEREQGGKIGQKNLIPPQKGHPVVTLVRITEEQALKWEDLKELVFMVNGYVEFEDVLENLRNQPFSGLIACSKKAGVRFIPPYGSGLYLADAEKEDKNPN